MIKTSHSIDLNELCKGKIPISLIYEVKYFIEENNMEFTTYDQFNTVISFESYDDARMMLNWIENTTFPETLFPSLDEYLLSATIDPCVYHIPEDKALSDCHLTTFTDEMYELWKKFKIISGQYWFLEYRSTNKHTNKQIFILKDECDYPVVSSIFADVKNRPSTTTFLGGNNLLSGNSFFTTSIAIKNATIDLDTCIFVENDQIVNYSP